MTPWRDSLLKFCIFLCCGAALCSGPHELSAAEPGSDEWFEKRIRPVLAQTCFRCHGDERTAAKLRVDSLEALRTGGNSGPAIEPGEPDESLLIDALRRVDGVAAMPPDKPLPPEQVADFVAWVKAGAPWPKDVRPFQSARHWAFEPIREPPIPVVNQPGWVQTSVDAFILHRLESAELAPAQKAVPQALLRRVTYDLTGLPPTPADAIDFANDPSPKAFERVVERLLASPQYGEHWGRHWLDVVRYADTAGENSDHPLPHAWRYRNWVIDAFNRDLPYNEFIRQQLAGDLLAVPGSDETYANPIIATGYLAIARRFGHDIDKDMHLTHEDTIDTVGKSFLGLSLGCCRCHDHKFDPLSARDYYGLYGIFDSTRFAFPGCEPAQQPRDLIPLLPAAEIERLTQPFTARLAALDDDIKKLTEGTQQAAAKLKSSLPEQRPVLSAGEIDDGGSAEFHGASPTGSEIKIQRGEILLMFVTPRGNHGADSTLLDWTIQEQGGDGRKWSTADLVDDLLAGNPHADRFENPNTWYFLDARDGLALLPESLPAINNQPALQAWRNGDTPSIFVNSSAEPVSVWTKLPAKSFFVHPGPQGPVALAWISPREMTVTISGRIADAHPGGGDGVGWRLEQLSAPDLSAHLADIAALQPQLAKLRAERDEIARQKPVIPVAYAVTEGNVHNARLQQRGEPTNLGDEVPRKFLDRLGGSELQHPEQSGRLELADWLTDPHNPLTARVIVNRVWQWHFGRGLVTTPNDFGTRGTPPSHPELLDHLASEFVKHGWSLKELHRLILLSATYQQAAIPTEHPELFAAFPRRRLTAEEIRDTFLSVSGKLDATPGAAHPFPPESTWSFTQHAPFAAEYDTNRRSVYVMQKRNRRNRFFALFDGPDPNTSTPKRDLTTVPTQALYFMNDPFVHESASALAARLIASQAEPAQRVELAYQLALGRPPVAEELADALGFVQESRESLANGSPAEQEQLAWAAWARVLLCSNELLHLD